MPTPFYHLSIAENLIHHPALLPSIQGILQEHRGAFLFGNTAPDVQVMSGQKRQATHFFTLPLQKFAQSPWDRLLASQPSLVHSVMLQPDHAAFLAGYLCHLQADWLWIREIFIPSFGPNLSWQTFGERLYLHNALRAYLDEQVLSSLPAKIGSQLKAAQPKGWLPFVQDLHLIQWRDFLSGQLQPGAVVQTVEVFASRQGIDPTEFHSLIRSEKRMDKEVFQHLPRLQVHEYRRQLVEMNLHLLEFYLGDRTKDSPQQSYHRLDPPGSFEGRPA